MQKEQQDQIIIWEQRAYFGRDAGLRLEAFFFFLFHTRHAALHLVSRSMQIFLQR